MKRGFAERPRGAPSSYPFVQNHCFSLSFKIQYKRFLHDSQIVVNRWIHNYCKKLSSWFHMSLRWRWARVASPAQKSSKCFGNCQKYGENPQIGKRLVHTDSHSLAVVTLSPTKNSLTKTESMVATSASQVTYFFFDSFWKLWEKQVKTSGKNKNVAKVR